MPIYIFNHTKPTISYIITLFLIVITYSRVFIIENYTLDYRINTIFRIYKFIFILINVYYFNINLIPYQYHYIYMQY